MNDHPARPVRNLNDVHRLGKCGLNAIFTPGSKWYYHNTEGPVLTVTPRGAYVDGVNYSKQPQDSEALGQPCWYIEATHGNHTTGYPPHTLIPHAVVVAQRACEDRATPQQDTIIEDLERRLAACEAALAEKDRKLTNTRDSLRAQRTRADNAVMRYADLRASLRAMANNG